MEMKVLANECCNQCVNHTPFHPLEANPVCVHCNRVVFVKEDNFRKIKDRHEKCCKAYNIPNHLDYDDTSRLELFYDMLKGE